MGKHFGDLYKIRGIITFKISPFEQKAFAGFFSKGIPNTFRRFRENVLRVAPPFLLTYCVIDQVEKAHAASLRKNPDDYMFDEFLRENWEDKVVFQVYEHPLKEIYPGEFTHHENDPPKPKPK